MNTIRGRDDRDHRGPEDGPTARPAASVRVARRDDYPAIREILCAAFGPFAAHLAPGVFEVYLADLLDLDAHARYGELLVGIVDGQVAGYAAFYPDASVQGFGWPQDWAGGRGLAVHPGYRGHGVARALIDEIIRRARRSGAAAFAFHTSEFMTSAVALYERLGYRRAPEFDIDANAHYGRPGATPWRAIAYLHCFSDRPERCAQPDLPAARAA